jgi:hypothetical protein
MRSFLSSNSSVCDNTLLPGPHDLFQLLLNDNRDILAVNPKPMKHCTESSLASMMSIGDFAYVTTYHCLSTLSIANALAREGMISP